MPPFSATRQGNELDIWPTSDLSIGDFIVQTAILWEPVSPINSFCTCALIEAPERIYAEEEPCPCGDPALPSLEKLP